MSVSILAVGGRTRAALALCEFLRGRSQVCELAGDVAEAAASLRNRRYDLIVADFTDFQDVANALSGELRQAGHPNRQTRIAAICFSQALEQDGDRIVLEQICHHFFHSTFDKSKILALYRCLSEKRFGEFFSLAGPGRRQTALAA